MPKYRVTIESVYEVTAQNADEAEENAMYRDAYHYDIDGHSEESKDVVEVWQIVEKVREATDGEA